MNSYQAAVVIDNGSGCCKVGFAGQDNPKSIIPSVVGRPKVPSIMVGMDQKDAYVGQEAENKKGILNMRYPIQHGVVVNWQDMTKIWHHCYYNQLKATPQQHPTMLTQAPKNPRANRQKMTQIMFQTFNIPSFYLGIQSVLALYASGITTGIALDSGDGVTQTVPIYQGHALSHAIQRNDLAGRDLTQYMMKLLKQNEVNFRTSGQDKIARKIKQQLCQVSLNYAAQEKKALQSNQKGKQFKLPDGQIINIGVERFKCAEVLFNPQLIDKQMPGFHQIAHQSIMKCDADLRKDLYLNIVLSGGTTLLPNLNKRLDQQLQKLAGTMKVKIHAAESRRNFVWKGGSILSFLSTFQNMWISKSQYQEAGPQIVHKKCF